MTTTPRPGDDDANTAPGVTVPVLTAAAAALAGGAASPPPPLPGFLAALAGPLEQYGLWAIFVLVLLEDFGIPVPGETVLIAGAVYAGSGRMNVVAVAGSGRPAVFGVTGTARDRRRLMIRYPTQAAMSTTAAIAAHSEYIVMAL